MIVMYMSGQELQILSMIFREEYACRFISFSGITKSVLPGNKNKRYNRVIYSINNVQDSKTT